MPNADNVVYAAPGANGPLFVAPAKTALPTDAATELTEAYKALGFMKSDGVVENNSITNTDFEAHGGAIVLSIEGGNKVNYAFTPIEVMNPDLAKEIYGEKNVEVNTDGSIKSIKMNDAKHKKRVWVFEHLLSNDTVERIVIPNGKITAIGTDTRSVSAGMGPQLTVTPYPDESGVKVYKYYAKVAE